MSEKPKGHILIIDDEPNALKVLGAILEEGGFSVRKCLDAETAMEAVSNDYDAVLTDLRLPGRSGMDFFAFMQESYPEIPVIFLTAYGTVESAVEAMTRGAFYYFIKPPDYLNLKGILFRAVEQRRLKRELTQLREQLQQQRQCYRLTGANPKIIHIQDVINSVCDSESSVLICGETGTGKEMIARSLHHCSPQRQTRSFMAVNCAAIPGELIEAELFGYEKGAFTGATSRRIGRVEQASGGTLFLDEIGELDIAVQAKLLRVLQEKEIERLGSNEKIHVDFRLVSSTNRDLLKEIRNGNFREDLFYRIKVIQINVPPLRDRKEDIPLLVGGFLKEFCAREKKVLSLSDDVMALLRRYDWPGNIRQLRNIIESCVVLAKGREITAASLPDELFSERSSTHQPANATLANRSIRDLEAQAVEQTLRECEGNKSQAAQVLGISRKALYKKIKDYGIEHG
jgi:DNA-binding NtrC family response regulator